MRMLPISDGLSEAADRTNSLVRDSVADSIPVKGTVCVPALAAILMSASGSNVGGSASRMNDSAVAEILCSWWVVSEKKS